MDIPAVQATLRRFAAELLSFADRTSIELDASPGSKTHVLIDWENVQPSDVDVRELVPDATDLWLFHGPNQKNVAAHHATFGDRATPVRIARTGKNALDFHLTFYIGYIASRQPEARFIVISNDKGYGPMLEHAKELGFAADQVGFVRLKGRGAATKSAAAKARGAGTATKAARKTRPSAAAPTRVNAATGPLEAATGGAAKAATATRRSAPTKTPAKRSAQESTRADAAPQTDARAAKAASSRTRPRPSTPPAPAAGKSAPKAAKATPAPAPAAKGIRRPAAGKTAKAEATSSAAAAPSRRRKPATAAAESPSRVDPGRAASPRTGKSFEQVVALLGKRPVDRLPHKQARLLADVAQMIGAAADSGEARAMLDRLVASGKVSIDERRTVRYVL
ncbi:MAG TPA: PIN domain-containing protein [Caldimonas sp.]|nr:PIN domain-containing protein [Caldimonas sp.]